MYRQRVQPITPLRAACQGFPLSLFYGDEPELDTAREYREARAKEICGRCPMRRGCLDEELARKPYDQHGIRGGLTAAERRAEIKRRSADIRPA